MGDRVNAWDVIRQELPKFMQEDQAEGLRGTLGALVPQDASDLALAVAGGPVGKLAKLGALGLAGATYSPDAEAGALNQLRRLVVGSKDLDTLRQAFKHITSRRPDPRNEEEWRRVAMANELVANAEQPGVRTHIFTDDAGNAKGGYQLQAGKKEGTYLPYMVSDEKGLGAEMLDDAHFMSPTKPLELYAVPGSEGFYRKQKGWNEQTTDGISKFNRMAHGGLVESDQPFSSDDLAQMPHDKLLALRAKHQAQNMQELIAPYEHRAYAREAIQDNPLNFLAMALSIPGYSALKAVGALRGRTPASLEQVKQGFIGSGEGLQAAIDKIRN